MKKLSLILGLCLLFFVLQAQTQTFVYSKTGEKVVLEKNDNIQYIHFVPNVDAKNKENLLSLLKGFTTFVDMVTPEIYRCDLSGKQVSNFTNMIKNSDIDRILKKL